MEFKDLKAASKYDVISKKDFAANLGVKTQAIDYQIDQGNVDFVMVGLYRMIVLTPVTRNYTPNNHKKRTVLKLKK